MTEAPVEQSRSLFQPAGPRVSRFFRHHLGDLRVGGPNALLRKAFSFLGLLLAALPLLSVRVIRPFVLVRFGCLSSRRIGHFAGNTEVYLCERDAGMHGRRRALDIFYHDSPVCNHQLKKMWERILPINRFAGFLARLNQWLPGAQAHIVPWRYSGDRDIYGLLSGTQPHLSFTREEERRGQAELVELGIPQEAPFVCFHGRDSAYLDHQLDYGDWGYHDYRDSTIQNYVLAAEELASRGYVAIRMGALVKEPIRSLNSKVIDYATKARNEFLDIYLGAKCTFFIGSGTGIDNIPMIFRRPMVTVNLMPIGLPYTWGPDYLFIPKKLWLKKEQRYLTMREAFDSGAATFLQSELYEDHGIEIVENTPEEITSLVLEMDERLKGNWRTSDQDEDLQQRYWSFFQPNEWYKVFRARIGAQFLRENHQLLD